MAQKITVKEVIPSKGEKSPTVIVASDGARMSGFHTGLKDVKPGAVLEVEVEVKGKYINILDFKEISPGVAGPGNGNQYREDPVKRASIEAESGVKNVMHSYTQLLIAGADIPPRLDKLWDRSLDWCEAKIPVFGKGTKPPAGDKRQTVKPAAGNQTSAEEDWERLGKLDFDPTDLEDMIAGAKFKDVTVKTYCISQYKEDANGKPLDKSLEIVPFVASLKVGDREKLFKYLQERGNS